MAAKLTFKYGREGDILPIDTRPPYPAQESAELSDDIIARLNPATAEVANLEVLLFSPGFFLQNCLNCRSRRICVFSGRVSEEPHRGWQWREIGEEAYVPNFPPGI